MGFFSPAKKVKRLGPGKFKGVIILGFGSPFGALVGPDQGFKNFRGKKGRRALRFQIFKRPRGPLLMGILDFSPKTHLGSQGNGKDGV